MSKIRLYIKCRKQGCRIDSIPLIRLKELAGFKVKTWEFKDGWLTLEAI